ncbi:protein FAR1-RELATED SEQUENCE 5-like [Arachis duranensis]|uniref:Protein FAR1-RELATED SEQUENCE 5-like n=1 Tax=Arachis duranensis TaxID=130453 RepID=A0A6P4BUG8_ARADU|nr:protein FAR1-RELATED SEQUENCE 5-like [Arachis duranensis]
MDPNKKPEEAATISEMDKGKMVVLTELRNKKNNEEVGIRPSKTFQSFVVAAGGHRELNFIKKDVRNYITREVQNISEQDDAKGFGKYLLRMKKKNQNFFFELEIEDNQSIKLGFWADTRSIAAFESISEMLFHSTPPTIQTVGEQVSSSIFNKFAVTYDSVAAEINVFDAASAAHSNSNQYQWHVMNYQLRVPAAGDNSLGV